MKEKERHLSLGPDYKYDRSKTIEENMIAEKEYLRKKGIDVSSNPELEKRVRELLKEYDSVIDEDLRKMVFELKSREQTGETP